MLHNVSEPQFHLEKRYEYFSSRERELSYVIAELMHINISV